MKKLILLLLCLGWACSDDSPAESPNNNDTENIDPNHVNDAGNNEPDAEEDIISIGDVNNTPMVEVACFEEISAAWPLNARVTTEQVMSSQQGAVYTATIQAAAGGSMMSASNPFVYLDLATGTRVDVDDFEAFSSVQWDLAFKRVVIRTNSSSSGIGEGGVMRLTETDFDSVTEVPGNAVFTADDTFDEECAIETDSIGLPATAFNFVNLDNPSGSQSWYNYGANGVEVPPGTIYLVRGADGSSIYKLEIQSWVGGTYTVRWSEL